MSMHLILQPFSCILLSVTPDIYTCALDFIHLKLTSVDRSICECKLATPILLSFKVLAIVDSAIRPSFKALSMLLVVPPLADIFSTICVRISANSISLVVKPFTLIDVAIRMEQFTLSVGLSSPPFALVFRSVEPLLFAHSVTFIVHPFTLIGGSRLKLLRRAVNSNVF